MAQERGYDQVTSPQAGAAMPRPSADQFGAGVGDGLAKLGEQVHGQQIRAFEIDKKIAADRQTSDWSHRFAVKRTALDDQVRDLRTNGQPGGEGHIEAVGQAWDSDKNAMFAGIDDPGVRRMAEQQWDSYGTALHGQEADWQEGQRVGKTVTDRQSAIDLGSNRVRRGVDPKAYAQELGLQLETNAALNLDEGSKAKLDKYTEQSFGLAAGQHLNDTNPQFAKQLFDSGEFDFLDPATLEQLRNGADVKIHTFELQERTKKAADLVDFGQQARLLIKAGNDDLPFDDKLPASMEERGKALGAPPELMYDLSQLRVTNQVRHEYKPATAVMIEADLAALDTRIAKLGDKVPVPMVQRRAALNKVLEARRSAVKADPLAVAARSGITVPDVDWSAPNGQQIAARVQAGHSASALTGAPLTFFRADEANQFKQEYAKGQQGQLNVLHVLDQFTDPFDRAAAAQQLAPADTNFQHMAQLRPEHRAVVQRGQQARAANKAFFTPPTGDPQGVGAAMAKIDQEQAFALRAMHPADAAAIRDNARDYYAGFLAARGHQSVNEGFSANDYQVALRVAGGGTVARGGSTGGMGYWQGTPFWVPDGFSHEGFQMAVLRDRATQERAGAGPVQPDGKTPFDLNRAWPTMIAPGRYRWDTKGGTVRRRGGGDYITTAEAGR